VLIDGGPIGTATVLRRRIEQITSVEERRFELLIVTHVDSDHIAGILKLLQAPPAGFHVEEVWFNAYQQLSAGILGAKEGEFLSVHFDYEERKRSGYWNGSFQGKAVRIPENGPLPTFNLAGDLKLTVLAPDTKALVKLRREWETVVEKYFEPGDLAAAKAALERDRRYRPGYLGAIDITTLARSPFEEDTSLANGSSIVVLTEYGKHRCLFAADATPRALVSALQRLPYRQTGRIALSVVKVPHHGSMNNNSSELYRSLDCPNYLVSTNGDRHCHPHAEAIARIVEASRRPPHLYFNYRSPFNDMWRSEQVASADSRYTSHFPERDDEGLRVELEDS
jgi:beta-lactamase superfamily II metal-dependent hydrolase